MDRDQLREFYETVGREELRIQKDGPHYLEYLTASKFIGEALPASSRILDSCAGTGAYAFLLAGDGHRVTAGDIVHCNVELMRRLQADNPALEDIYEGDATDLTRFPDGSFDAVLLMGALYHLPELSERRRAVRESARVLRQGGILACTYMNRFAVLLGNMSGDLDNMDEILAFVQHGREGIFYASTPRETEGLLGNSGLAVERHIALDGISNFLHQSGVISDTGLQRWRRYHFAVCEEPSLLGYSYHNLVIGQKR